MWFVSVRDGRPAGPPLPCSLSMFHNRTGAWRACRAQWALQRNWFPDPIQGLFSYQAQPPHSTRQAVTNRHLSRNTN